MWKFNLVALFIFSACSNFTFNGTMCDQIASDPHATMPKECRRYSEEEAEKAFNKPNKKLDINDTIEFNKE